MKHKQNMIVTSGTTSQHSAFLHTWGFEHWPHFFRGFLYLRASHFFHNHGDLYSILGNLHFFKKFFKTSKHQLVPQHHQPPTAGQFQQPSFLLSSLGLTLSTRGAIWNMTMTEKNKYGICHLQMVALRQPRWIPEFAIYIYILYGPQSLWFYFFCIMS